MTTLTDAAVLATETQLPMNIVGWGALALGLFVVIVWTLYLYR
ncbi:hypothetical protein [Natrinema limicola]|uniref:Uncharacterized protein n=1 Tax=Natrinema limicola JCM 13563 TaxID=1230457 RepID=M0CU41_9EURY|nr:hypothetical protein [Natrinema limicola]ELZ25394.1 hypothetical protein C476_03122 [Natrinema limicola JCM 13563]